MTLNIVQPQKDNFVDEQGNLTPRSFQFAQLVANLDPIYSSGSPEGVVEARVPRFYVDIASGTNVLYVKTQNSIGGDRTLGWRLVSSGGGGGTVIISTTNTDKSLVTFEECHATVSGLTIDLPSSPSAGDDCWIGVGNFTDTIAGRSGENIMSLASDLTLNQAWRTYWFRYINSSIGWRVV